MNNNLIKSIIQELDNIVNVRHVRGYGAGHVYSKRRNSFNLGMSYHKNDESDKDEDDESESKDNIESVKTSKAFDEDDADTIDEITSLIEVYINASRLS